MNIYAVRDRLIDYYMQPFAAHTDKAVMAAMALQVNEQGDPNGIAQAPHHFEIWKLGKVTEAGDVVPEKELVCTCTQLIRPGVRTTGQDTLPLGAAPSQRTGTQGGNPGASAANTRPAQNAPQATPGADRETNQGPRGPDTGSNP